MDVVAKNNDQGVIIRTVFTTTGIVSLLYGLQATNIDVKRFYGINGILLITMGISANEDAYHDAGSHPVP